LYGHGVIGVGQVYAAYRSGELVDDADVAVLHSADEACRRLTVALVSVNWGARQLLESGTITEAGCVALVQLARSLHFSERSHGALAAVARASVHSKAMLILLEHLAAGHDVKRLDALAAIRELLRTLDLEHSGYPEPVNWCSSYAAEWRLSSSFLDKEQHVTERRALAYLQLFCEDFPETHRAYVKRLVRTTLGQKASLDPGESAALLAASGFSCGSVLRSPFVRRTAGSSEWSSHDRALVRTFRLSPGRAAYLRISPEILARYSQRALVQRCMAVQARVDSVPASGTEWRAFLARLWRTSSDEEFYLSLLERGFRDSSEVLRLAAGFDLDRVKASTQAGMSSG
jgi:hypothetical protein